MSRDQNDTLRSERSEGYGCLDREDKSMFTNSIPTLFKALSRRKFPFSGHLT